jgi:hypothetical protein
MKDELSQDARRLFASARASFSPEDSRVAAVRAAIDVRIAAPSPSVSGARLSGGAGAAAGAASSSGMVGIGLVAAALLAGGAGVIAYRHQAPSVPAVVAAPPLSAFAMQAPPVPAAPPAVDRRTVPANDAPEQAPALPTVNAEALPMAAPPSVQPSRSAPVRAHASRNPVSALAGQAPAPAVDSVPAQPSGEEDSLARETSLLRSARTALDAGDANRALALLARHAQLWPEGVLAEERLATKVLALCALGRVTEARETAGELESLSPTSPHLTRVRSSCARRAASGGP